MLGEDTLTSLYCVIMTLSEELKWRGFVNQTTYKDVAVLDGEPINFYFGVDPSSDSMTIGNLASAMMVKHFINHGHKATLLVGGATGMIGDPDGKVEERELKSLEEIAHNKQQIAAQYQIIFAAQPFEVVDNYDWFKDMGYLKFLREVGKHVPMRQMLSRDFVQSRLGEGSSGISYAEFSYSLIQGYDFLHLYREKGITLQLCGADQWGNSVAGVELIRRITGGSADIWSAPLVINKSTGVKFGKSEGGAIWLDPSNTSPTQFYQFWINVDDDSVEELLKMYTLIDEPTLTQLITEHNTRRQDRLAQTRLAQDVTTLIHGEDNMHFAELVTEFLTGKANIAEADDLILSEVRRNLPNVKTLDDGSIIDALVSTSLTVSNSEARRLMADNGISINGTKVNRENFEASDFLNGRLLLRRGRAFKDSALVEL